MNTLRSIPLLLAIMGNLFAGSAPAQDAIITTRTSGTATDAAEASNAASSLKVIYSTLNQDRKHLFSWKKAWAVAGPDDGGDSLARAVPFTPAVDATLRKIVLALGFYSGTTNAATVTLREDADGLPGAAIKKFQVVDIPESGQCCETVSVGMKGVPVTGGRQYWVAVSAKGDAYITWQLNNIALVGPNAYAFNGEWALTSDKLAAFSVLGD